MVKSIYRSCNCKTCRHSSGWRSEKFWRKTALHRAFRRKVRQALRSGQEVPEIISGDYVA